MGTNYLAILGVTTMTTVMSCSSAKKEYASYELYPGGYQVYALGAYG